MKVSFKYLIPFFIAPLHSPVYADALFVEHLSFGTVAVGSNHSVSTITVTTAGNMVTTGSAYVLAEGHPAELELSDLPARKELTLTATLPTSLIRVGGGTTNYFNLSAISLPSRVVTDGTGYALVPIGGTLATSGNSQTYLDGLYRWSLEITVTYN